MTFAKVLNLCLDGKERENRKSKTIVFSKKTINAIYQVNSLLTDAFSIQVICLC